MIIVWPYGSNRPLVNVEFLIREGKWVGVKDMVLDTGACISILPKEQGKLITAGYRQVGYYNILSIFGETRKLPCFCVPFRFNEEWPINEVMVAVSDSDISRPVFGRKEALDLFTCTFYCGKKIIIL